MTTCTWKSHLEAVGLLVLRILMGLGIAMHGWHKMMGDMSGFADGAVGMKMGLAVPLFFAWAAALSEGVGGVLIALGLATRVAAFFVLCVMAGAFFLFHAADPWNVKELAFLYGSVALALIFIGAGCYSLDALIFGKKE